MNGIEFRIQVKDMKVLLYFEAADKIKKSGIGRALRHQIEALTDAGVEYTLDPNDSYDIAHINTYFPSAKRLLKRLKKRGVPVIVHGHSTIEDFRDSFRFWRLMSLWFNRNLLWFYKNADLIITPTLYSKNLIDSYGLGTEVIYISNGINPDEYAYSDQKISDFRKFFDIKEGEKTVIGIGFPFNRKGIKDFFEVAERFPDVKFIWFGYLQKILTEQNVLRAIKHRPKNVIMPGYIDNSIIKGALCSSECLFFPSHEETEGIVVLEALASDCPVLIRDIGVYADWLTDGVNCFKATDVEGFCEKLVNIMSHDNGEIIKSGRTLAAERSLPKVGRELKSAYETLLQ